MQISTFTDDPGLEAITFLVNAQVYIEVLDTFVIPSVKRRFGDEDVISQDDNASRHRAKSIKKFPQGRPINATT